MTDERAEILEHADFGGGYRLLSLAAPQIAAAVTPGQFVHVRVPVLESSALRRPFSVCDAEDGRLTILYKTVGRGTAALASARPGETLNVLGPLGHGFPTTVAGEALLVGGGFGVAPLYFLAKRLGEPGRIRLFAGGRTSRDLLMLDRFARLGVEVRLATDDGSAGEKGLVTVPLDAAMADLRKQGAAFELFACGPDPMLRAITSRAVALGVPGWISMDRHMACGVGACYGCIQKTVRGNERCCVDGPVFAAADLVL